MYLPDLQVTHGFTFGLQVPQITWPFLQLKIFDWAVIVSGLDILTDISGLDILELHFLPYRHQIFSATFEYVVLFQFQFPSKSFFLSLVHYLEYLLFLEPFLLKLLHFSSFFLPISFFFRIFLFVLYSFNLHFCIIFFCVILFCQACRLQLTEWYSAIAKWPVLTAQFNIKTIWCPGARQPLLADSSAS